MKIGQTVSGFPDGDKVITAVSRTRKPSKRVALVPRPPEIRYCEEDGKPFYPKRVDQIFCCFECTQKHHRRRNEGGRRLYDAAMPWRIDRPRNALVELTAVADQLAAEERIIRRRREETIAAAKAAAKKARR